MNGEPVPAKETGLQRQRQCPLLDEGKVCMNVRDLARSRLSSIELSMSASGQKGGFGGICSPRQGKNAGATPLPSLHTLRPVLETNADATTVLRNEFNTGIFQCDLNQL